MTKIRRVSPIAATSKTKPKLRRDGESKKHSKSAPLVNFRSFIGELNKRNSEEPKEKKEMDEGHKTSDIPPQWFMHW